MRARYFAAAALALLPAAVAHAGETVTYTYDAKGRLTNVQHAGGRNDGASSTYTFDAADNRTSVVTAGYRPLLIVLPLMGLTVLAKNNGTDGTAISGGAGTPPPTAGVVMLNGLIVVPVRTSN